MNLIAVFRSRTQTLAFAQILSSYGIMVSIINTPRTINVACGISAKFPAQFKKEADEIIRRRAFSTFAGFYHV